MRGRLAPLLVVACATASCVPPRALPLPGATTTRPLPRADVPPGYTRVRFRWLYSDPQIDLAGDGQARIAAPDSARLDFLVDAGAGGGFALIFGDTLLTPTASSRRIHGYLPPAPMLWAAFGRFAVPPAPDTVLRLDGDTLWADIGVMSSKGLRVAWRVAFAGRQLATLERLSAGRVRDVVTRVSDTGDVVYERLGSRRTLTLTKITRDSVAAFDAAIWAQRH